MACESWRGRPLGTTIVCVLATLLVVAGVAFLIASRAILPHEPKYYVDDASVSQFNLTSNGFLNANLDINIATRNPSGKIAISYESLRAYLLYKEKQIGWATLTVFYHGHKNTTFLQANVTGRGVALDPSFANDLKLQQAAGTLDLDLKLQGRLRFKVGSWKSKRYTMEVICHHVIFGVNGGVFKPLQCRVAF